MTTDAPDTIVLVHGFWVTPRSWEEWIDHYESKGFTVLAPAYPGFEVEVESLNADPTPIADSNASFGGHEAAQSYPCGDRVTTKRQQALDTPLCGLALERALPQNGARARTYPLARTPAEGHRRRPG